MGLMLGMMGVDERGETVTVYTRPHGRFLSLHLVL